MILLKLAAVGVVVASLKPTLFAAFRARKRPRRDSLLLVVLPLLVPLPTRSNPRIRLKDLLLRITDADGGAAGSAIPFDGFVSFASSAAVVNTDFDRRKNGGAILSSIGIEIYIDAI